jgi:putative membrane protein insertion efficiency factor
VVGGDLARPPERQLTARVLLATIGLYRGVGDRLLPGVHCRMRPSCSRYAEVVISKHGAVRGGWLTLRRLVRCGPWTPAGTVDLPPGV